MFKYRISRVLPFWAKNNENKPNREIFNNFINDMIDVENFNVNFLGLYEIEVMTPFNDIKYIEITNLNNENDKRYYYLNKLKFNTNSGLYSYNFTLDIYCSYTLNFLYENINRDFIFLRKHEYNKNMLLIDDSNILSLPKLYKNYYFKKVLFNYNEAKKVWYSEKIGLSGDDLLNANKYYVFKDGTNGGYKYYPVISKALNATIYYENANKGQILYEGFFSNGRSNGQLFQNIPSELNNAIVEAYKNNNIIEYYYRKVNYGYIIPAHTVWLSGWTKINNVPYGTLPLDISAYNTSGNSAGAGLRYIDYNINLLGNNIYHAHYSNITVSKFGDIDNVRDLGCYFKVIIYKNNPTMQTKKIKNSITGLEELRRKEENINKFLGIYYLPHFLNFNKFDFDGDYVYISINPQGDNIKLFNIYDYNISNITNKINNPTYSTPYLLKYLNIKYYGNNIAAEYRINDMNKIFIGGKLFFTDTANIISKSDNLISLENAIINYPYQLPVGVDTYEQYVKANRNTTETGFNIVKQQQDMAIAKTLFNGAMGGVEAIGKAVSGDFVGAATKAIKAGAGTAFGIVGQIQGIQQMEQKIKAQYKQANMTMGNNIQYSNISNAALTAYYDSDNEQYEGVEVSDLDDNTLIQINNYLYLNGYLYPEKDKLNNRINNDRLFNFIQIDSELLTTMINITYNVDKLDNENYALIRDQLINGIRVWNQNKDNIDIPTYDDNEVWPDQPNDTRPNLPPSQPPLESPEYQEIKINDILYPNTCATIDYSTFLSISLLNENIGLCYTKEGQSCVTQTCLLYEIDNYNINFNTNGNADYDVIILKNNLLLPRDITLKFNNKKILLYDPLNKQELESIEGLTIINE